MDFQGLSGVELSWKAARVDGKGPRFGSVSYVGYGIPPLIGKVSVSAPSASASLLNPTDLEPPAPNPIPLTLRPASERSHAPES